jgi:hypothetical protein
MSAQDPEQRITITVATLQSLIDQHVRVTAESVAKAMYEYMLVEVNKARSTVEVDQ